MLTDVSPGLILEKLKDYNYIKIWCNYIKKSNIKLRINQYCDILEIVTQKIIQDCEVPILNIYNLKKTIEIIRFFSFSAEESSYYLLSKTFKNESLFKIIYSGFVIKVLTKKKSSKCLLQYLIKGKYNVSL